MSANVRASLSTSSLAHPSPSSSSSTTKFSALPFVFGPGAGYEKLNWIHKAAGRGIFLAAAVHGSLWINNRLVNDQPILGMFKHSPGIGVRHALRARSELAPPRPPGRGSGVLHSPVSLFS
jgi:hypothetical protein